MLRRSARFYLLPFLLLLLGSGSAASMQVPDLTAGDPRPAKALHDWNLGATGARGWIYSEKMVTHLARQILITEVALGSPADKVLKVGDVILGVDGNEFQSDPRVAFGQALTRAESKNGRGRLSLLRWRDGRRNTVTVKLPVLGSWSATAPFDCPKSARLYQQGCEQLARTMQKKDYRPNPIPRCLNALALLASGERKYRGLIHREVEWASQFSADSFQTWYYGYVCMLLAEYSVATGDDRYLPGLRRLALEAARGQSAVGSWGHKFAQPSGRLAGYGMMNAPGVPLTIALVMARRAGVDDPEISTAIERSVHLLRFYVGKGAIPYGDHHPWIQTHEDNGKCGMGAVLFDLLGDAEAANFFARMSLASHGPERDGGHTGNFFNMLWAMPAVARSGPAAAGAWMNEFGSWYFDLARRPDGGFTHLGPPEDGWDKYRQWDASGAYLLALAMPLHSLMLTGRDPGVVNTLNAAQAEEIIAAGRGWNNFDRIRADLNRSPEELLSRLASWSPVVRERAAMALARNRAKVVPQLIAMLEGKDLNARIGACQALAQLKNGGAEAVPALRSCLQAPDLWLRVKAADALAAIGDAAMPALPDVLATLSRTPGPDDPRGMEQRYLCFALFDRRNGMLRSSLDRVDRNALHTAIRAGLHNEDGRARGAVSNVYERLPFESLQPLLPDIHEAILESAPSGIMFADQVRMAGLRLFAKHHIEVGLADSVYYLRHMKQHGSEKRIHEVIDLILSYGAHAKNFIPELEKIADFFAQEEQDFPRHLSLQKAQAVREAIAEIRTATDLPSLIQIKL